ncbi:ABC transporter permease [Nonomuraea angiospora]|uniref:ABC transporter permease n=1 Tax=Nonomuraea angiospora TaxID=46172 RepID=UPI003316AF86
MSTYTDEAVLSQSKLVWRAFRRHRLATAGLVVTALTYLVVVFAGFIAPYDTEHFVADRTYAPPQALHLFGDDGFGLHTYGQRARQDPETLDITWTTDTSQRIDIGFFVKGAEYSVLGLTLDRHLIGPVDPSQTVYFLGSDRTGHDVLSLMAYGARTSMTIGLLGVAIAFVIGITLGGISGYLAGKTDTAIQRVIEFFMSMPTLPLWLGLAAALPSDWSALQRYFAITLIVAVIGWTDLARVVRGRFLALREEQYVTAARLDGSSAARIIRRHLLPSMSSHLIASLTLSIPGMILAETALSFLGLGIQAPDVSWGVLLQESQNLRAVTTAPWLLLPGLAVIVVVLALNFLGDGLRDAADPYSR